MNDLQKESKSKAMALTEEAILANKEPRRNQRKQSNKEPKI